MSYVKYSSALLVEFSVNTIFSVKPEGTQLIHSGSQTAQGKVDWKLIAK